MNVRHKAMRKTVLGQHPNQVNSTPIGGVLRCDWSFAETLVTAKISLCQDPLVKGK